MKVSSLFRLCVLLLYTLQLKSENACPVFSKLRSLVVSDVVQCFVNASLLVGAPKVVEFEFDLGSDTAISVASEMVEEMSLSHSDAARIAQAIKEEIFNLTHKVQSGQHRAAASYGSVSDDESAAARPPPSEGGTAAFDGGLHEGNITDVKYEACFDIPATARPLYI